MKLPTRVKGDALALLVWGAATCASCRGAAPISADTTITPKPKAVVVDDWALNALEFNYHTVTLRAGLEAGFCLYGRNQRDSIYVDRIEFPFVKESSPNHIEMACRQERDFLGFAHTHDFSKPYNQPCAHSPKDLEGFDKGNLPLSIVYCGNGLANVVTSKKR